MEAIVKMVEVDLSGKKPPVAPNSTGFTKKPKGKPYRDQKGYMKMNSSQIVTLHSSLKFLVSNFCKYLYRIFQRNQIGNLNLRVAMISSMLFSERAMHLIKHQNQYSSDTKKEGILILRQENLT